MKANTLKIMNKKSKITIMTIELMTFLVGVCIELDWKNTMLKVILA